MSIGHTEGTDNQTYRGHTEWGTVGKSTVHIEGTANQTDKGHTQWGTLEHCQLYIQRAQTTRPTGGTHSGAHCTYIAHSPVRQESTGALSTVHAEGTEDKPVDGGGGHRGHRQSGRQRVGTLGHCSTVNRLN